MSVKKHKKKTEIIHHPQWLPLSSVCISIVWLCTVETCTVQVFFLDTFCTPLKWACFDSVFTHFVKYKHIVYIYIKLGFEHDVFEKHFWKGESVFVSEKQVI